jgi:hypothetical protein
MWRVVVDQADESIRVRFGSGQPIFLEIASVVDEQRLECFDL